LIGHDVELHPRHVVYGVGTQRRVAFFLAAIGI
jgi:hypothetical protein